MQTDRNGAVLALDVGAARVGLALANMFARIAHPAGALPHNDALFESIRDLCRREDVTQLVIGLPRGLNGQETAQTSAVREFAAKLQDHIAIPQHWQDEAVTSAQAEAELQRRGKPYAKGDVDALAATLILEDYLREHV